MRSFPIELLGEPLRSYVLAGAAALGCDPAFIAVAILPALASAIGNTRRIRLKRSWTEPPVLWAAVVGESGTGKSPALDKVMEPIWRRQKALFKEHAAQRMLFESELLAWKSTKGEARGERPGPPAPCEHLVCSDITVEALADRLLSSPRGTLVSVEEIAGWFGSFNRYHSGSSDVSHWLAMHGARPLKVDRKTGANTTIFVPNAAVSIVGTIQPGILGRILVPEFFESGLTARLLLVMPPTKPKRWSEREISQGLVQAMDHLFDKLFALRATNAVDGSTEPVMVDMTPAATESWAEFVNRHNEAIEGMEGHERAAAVKLEAYAARFALILHCVQQATGEKQSEYIEAADINAGVELAQWFGAETRRVYRVLNESSEEKQRRTLIEWIAGKGGRVTARDLQRNLRRYNQDLERAEADLDDLANRGDGSWETVRSGPSGGRPSRTFCLAASPDLVINRSADADTTGEFAGPFDVSSASALPEGAKSRYPQTRVG